jgi:hypothetical protein
VLVAGLTVAEVATSSAETATAPRTLLSMALGNAQNERGVHEVVVGYQVAKNGTDSTIYTSFDEIGRTEGRQELYSGNNGTCILQAFNHQKRMYEKASANEAALCLGVPAAGTTLASDFGKLGPFETVRYGTPTTWDRQPVLTILATASNGKGQPPERDTIYIAAKGDSLPMGAKFASPGYLTVVTWSHWGSTVSMVPPANAIAYPIGATG